MQDVNNLPIYGVREALQRLSLAGDVRQQAALSEVAWSILEPYETPAGRLGSRLSNAWLGGSSRSVQLVHHSLLSHPASEPWLQPLADAVKQASDAELLGTCVDPRLARHNTVWRISATPGDILDFFNAHMYGPFHMLFTRDLSLAICANEGDFAAVAAPATMLRQVLPPDEQGPAATQDLQEGLEEEHGEGFLDGILAHYAPFALDA